MPVQLPPVARCAVAAALLTALLTAPLTLAPAASAAPHRAAGAVVDFDGDKRGDLAVEAGGAEYVSVLFGGRPGRHQELPGTRPVTRDLDGDGRTDLAVRRTGDVGGVRIHWGTAAGLTVQPATLPASAQLDGRLTAGDFDGDGHQDLVAAAPEGSADAGLYVAHGPFGRTGTPARTAALETGEPSRPVEMAAGDFNGDGRDDLVSLHASAGTARPARLWTGTENGLSSTRALPDPAAAVTAGDVDGDGRDDLVIRTVPGGALADLDHDHGTVKVLHGSASGPGTRTTVLTQNSPGVPGADERGDRFGAALAAGDVDGDGYTDVAVGVPGEDLAASGENLADAGAAVLLEGGAQGLTGTGAVALHQNSAQVPGVAETGDGFGSAVTLGEVTGDGHADLAAGAPGEDTAAHDSGACWVLPGTATSVTGSGSYAVNPGDMGLDGDDTGLGSAFGR